MPHLNTARLQAGLPSCRSLHIMGTADELVSPARSTELMQCFGAAGDVFEYPGRHGIPCSAEFRTRLKAFLAEMAAASVG